MASRGRGRGRGSGGFFNTHAATVPFVLFPEDVNLPDAKVNDIDASTKKLLNWSYKLQNYWKASPYLLEEKTIKENQRMHIERFSDKKKTMFTRDSLSQVLVFNEFPKELVQGTSRRMPSRKKFRWNPESDIKRLDFFEQLEKKGQGREDKGEKENNEKENKEGENEDEDENAEDEEGEDFGDDDYNQNEYFDDDEDDYNDADDGDDEGIY